MRGAPDDDGGLYRSVDQGRTFEQVSDDERIRNRPFYYGNIEADPQNSDIVYSLAGRFVRSDDGGESWKYLLRHATRPFYHGQIGRPRVRPREREFHGGWARTEV